MCGPVQSIAVFECLPTRGEARTLQRLPQHSGPSATEGSRQQTQSPRAQKQKKERQRLHASVAPCVCLRTLTGASQGSSGRSRQGPPWPGPGPPSPAPGPPASPSRMQRLAVPELTGGASSLLGGRGRELAFAINFLRPIRCHLTRREALRTLQGLLCLSHPSHP